MTITSSSMGISCEDAYDKNEAPQFLLRDSRRCSGGGSATGVVVIRGVEMETQPEFEPIEHPLEPTDEDHPVQCPMPHSSLLNDKGMRSEQLGGRLWKSAELPLTVDVEGMVVAAAEPPTRSVRKRHHTLTGDHTAPPLLRSPSLPTLRLNHNTSMCRVLQQL